MKEISHNYSWKMQLAVWSVRFFVIGGTIITFLGLKGGNIIIYLVFGLIFLPLISLYWNMYPKIKSDDEGLWVNYLFWWLRVKWNDVIEVKPDFFSSLFNLRNKPYVVRTRSLTFFHRLYDQGFSFSPSFYLMPQISGFEELLTSIENKKIIPKSEK